MSVKVAYPLSQANLQQSHTREKASNRSFPRRKIHEASTDDSDYSERNSMEEIRPPSRRAPDSSDLDENEAITALLGLASVSLQPMSEDSSEHFSPMCSPRSGRSSLTPTSSDESLLSADKKAELIAEREARGKPARKTRRTPTPRATPTQSQPQMKLQQMLQRQQQLQEQQLQMQQRGMPQKIPARDPTSFLAAHPTPVIQTFSEPQESFQVLRFQQDEPVIKPSFPDMAKSPNNIYPSVQVNGVVTRFPRCFTHVAIAHYIAGHNQITYKEYHQQQQILRQQQQRGFQSRPNYELEQQQLYQQLQRQRVRLQQQQQMQLQLLQQKQIQLATQPRSPHAPFDIPPVQIAREPTSLVLSSPHSHPSSPHVPLPPPHSQVTSPVNSPPTQPRSAHRPQQLPSQVLPSAQSEQHSFSKQLTGHISSAELLEQQRQLQELQKQQHFELMQRLNLLQQKVQKKKAKSEKLGVNLAHELSLVKQQLGLGLDDLTPESSDSERSGILSPKRKREEVELSPAQIQERLQEISSEGNKKSDSLLEGTKDVEIADMSSPQTTENFS